MWKAEEVSAPVASVLDALTPSAALVTWNQEAGTDLPNEAIHGVMWRAVIDGYDYLGWNSSEPTWCDAMLRACTFRCARADTGSGGLAKLHPRSAWLFDSCGHGAGHGLIMQQVPRLHRDSTEILPT